MLTRRRLLPFLGQQTVIFPSTVGTLRDPDNFNRVWRQVRDELGASHDGIRVNAISAGHIATPMHADDDAAALAAMHPLGRMGSIADIVEGVRYLEAATFVSGEILHIDGGQSAGH